MLQFKKPMLHEMLQFEMPINPYKIVLGDDVTHKQKEAELDAINKVIGD